MIDLKTRIATAPLDLRARIEALTVVKVQAVLIDHNYERCEFAFASPSKMSCTLHFRGPGIVPVAGLGDTRIEAWIDAVVYFYTLQGIEP